MFLVGFLFIFGVSEPERPRELKEDQGNSRMCKNFNGRNLKRS